MESLVSGSCFSHLAMTTARLHQILKLLRAEFQLIEKTIDTLEATVGRESRPAAKPKTARPKQRLKR